MGGEVPDRQWRDSCPAPLDHSAGLAAKGTLLRIPAWGDAVLFWTGILAVVIYG